MDKLPMKTPEKDVISLVNISASRQVMAMLSHYAAQPASHNAKVTSSYDEANLHPKRKLRGKTMEKQEQQQQQKISKHGD